MNLILVLILVVHARACSKRFSNLVKEAEKWKQNAKKEFKEAKPATRSDSDTSNSDDNEDQVVNLSLVAKEGQVQEEGTECESSDEVDDSVFLEYFKDELAQALGNFIECEQKYLSK